MAAELLRREFSVEQPLPEAWRALAEVSAWPGWAPHLRRVQVEPAGPIGPNSTGSLSFRPLGRSQFRVSSYAEGAGWEWVGKVLWLTIRYDHRFAQDGSRTRMTWTVSEDGDRRSLLGRLFASVYGRLVDRAIPRLQEQLKSANRGA
ncbi:MAG TPA: SRPBCC family protein [Candidatus Limnocylindria bacterium]|nr:SRPBCC family protein [Candidatus Limnocylindria bacterium]